MKHLLFYLFNFVFFTISFAQEIPEGFITNDSTYQIFPFRLVEKANYDHRIVKRLSPKYAIIEEVNFFEKIFSVINNDWKFIQEYPKNLKGVFYIKTKKDLQHHLRNVQFLNYDARKGILKVRGNLSDISSELLPLSSVTAIQYAERSAKTESVLRSFDLSPNKINFVHHTYPNLNGTSLFASIKEGAFDITDLDITTRATLDEFSSPLVFSHATDMATLVGGAGNSSLAGTGVARRVQLYSDNFAELLPNNISYFSNRSISVQNHSYGVGIENFYGIESVAFDEQAFDMPSLLHVFSAGNSGTDEGTDTYEGVVGYANITGSFKHAKNVVLVTATNLTGEVPSLNSSGPAYDGRIKPEITAFGAEGTSEAAALVSGSALLIQERWQEEESSLPTSDMVKALLIAGSEDIMNEGPDFKSGYGQLNLFHSIQSIDSGWYATGSIAQGQASSIQLEVTESLKQLNVVLAWRDPAANSGDFMALINDLDLKVSKDGSEWLPWVLDSSPNVSNLSALAITGVDRLNNVEMITLYDVEAGTYTLEVSGFSVTGSQPYSLAYHQISSDHFVFTYPTSDDPLPAGEDVTIRWESGFDLPGHLEIDYLNDNWTSIDNSIVSDQGSITFATPDNYSHAVLRMTIDGQIFKSDTFAISAYPNLDVALDCEDQRVLSWNKIDPNVSYQLCSYANGLLEPILTTSDTFAILDSESFPQNYFSVRPIEEDWFGVRDETINLEAKNQGCYLNDFFLTLGADGSVTLTLDLNLPQEITDITITKSQSENVEIFQNFNPDLETYQFEDPSPFIGRTTYVATATLNSGETFVSNELRVSTTDDDTFFIFPNPVVDGKLKFLTPEKNVVLQLLNTKGEPITDQLLTEEFTIMPVWFLPSGLYMYRVLKNGSTLESGRVVIRN